MSSSTNTTKSMTSSSSSSISWNPFQFFMDGGRTIINKSSVMHDQEGDFSILDKSCNIFSDRECINTSMNRHYQRPKNMGGGAFSHHDERMIVSVSSPLPNKNSSESLSPSSLVNNNFENLNSTTQPSSSSSSQQLLYLKLSRNLLAGGLARCGAAIIMFPIDVVKTRLQFQREDAFIQGKLRHHYKHGVDAFTTILKEEGIRGLYKGISVRLVYITPAAAVSFTVYEQFMHSIQGRLSNGSSSNNGSSENKLQFSWTTPLLTLSAGLLARIFGTACRTPFDIVKQQLQVEGQLKLNSSERNLRSGIIGTAKNIAKQDGVSGFFSGYYVTLLRDAPFAAIYFTSYETIKRMLSIKQQQHDISTDELVKKRSGKSIHHLFAGALAGAIGTTCTIPVDVVKTRLQTQTKTGLREYDGVVDAFRKIYKQEGLKAFSKGLGPRLIYIMPASALTFTLYEKLKVFFNIEESTTISNTTTTTSNSSSNA